MFINTLGYINVYQNLGDMNVDVDDSLVDIDVDNFFGDIDVDNFFGDIDVDNCKDDDSYCVSQRFCIISWAWEYYYDESRIRSYHWLILSLVFVVSLLVLLSFLRGKHQEVDTNKEKEGQVGIGGSNMS